MGYPNGHDFSAPPASWNDIFKGFELPYKKAMESIDKLLSFQDKLGKIDLAALLGPGYQIYQNGYDFTKSILPFYDATFKFWDGVKMFRDLADKGINIKYPSRGPNFGSLSNYASSMQHDARSTLYSTGKLFRRL